MYCECVWWSNFAKFRQMVQHKKKVSDQMSACAQMKDKEQKNSIVGGFVCKLKFTEADGSAAISKIPPCTLPASKHNFLHLHHCNNKMGILTEHTCTTYRLVLQTAAKWPSPLNRQCSHESVEPGMQEHTRTYKYRYFRVCMYTYHPYLYLPN